MSIVHKLLTPSSFPHPVEYVRLLQTHISWVLLTGNYAYKFKKPVNLGFLDYSSLEKRRFYCEEELRLNRRLAPELYLEVVSINQGDDGSLIINGFGPIVEYAIKMIQFNPDQQLDVLLREKRLRADHLSELARRLAEFHDDTLVAEPGSEFGQPSIIEKAIRQNFQQLFPLLETKEDKHKLQALEEWSSQQLQQLQALILLRKNQGHVRECHGDMHLRNIALVDQRVVFFDCIEFNAGFRWIDTISELAFIVMDLYDQERFDFGHLILNVYLEITGDYEGVKVLRFYLVYRALVRAKVSALQAATENSEVKHVRHYIQIAQQFCTHARPLFLICHGLSGSGKTTISDTLMQELKAVRIRSDVERKRQAGLKPMQDSHSDLDSDLYSEEKTRLTYEKLAQLATTIIEANWNLIVDATFLKFEQREKFRILAQQLRAQFCILHIQASEKTLRKRIVRRQLKGDDVSEASGAVLQNQLQYYEPLRNAELEHTIELDSENPDAVQKVMQTIYQAQTDS